MTDYGLLAKQIVSLAEVDAHWLPVLSNAAALLWDALDDINWAGFYLVDPATVTGEGAEPGAIPSAHDSRTPELRLGPFQGKSPACAFCLVGECVVRLRQQRQVSW